FDLKGPSLAIDTACSSALVAIHLAVRSLRARECDYALVAGVQVGVTPGHYAALERIQALSPDGHCHSFDRSANGYVPGEGIGVVLLARAQAAWEAGDRIHACIVGSAINHGGQAAGLTVPNSGSQAQVIGEALADSGLSA